jgi:GT2 family glycosyltransferase
MRINGPSAALTWIRNSSGAHGEAESYLRWCALHTPRDEELRRMGEQSSQFAYQPLISILTPAYNTDPRWLEACADSVMAQAYPRWEWHLVNDGSTRPETLATLERIAGRDHRIRLHNRSENRGISAATNVALSAAEGDYIAMLDHDDALLPHALFRTVEALNGTGPRADVVYSDEDKLDLGGCRCDAYFKPDWSPDLFLSSMYVCHLLVARRALVLDVGGFRTTYDFAQDYDLVLRLMEKTSAIVHVPDVLYHWRKIPQSAAMAGLAKPTAHLAAQRALQDYLDRNGLSGRIEDAGPAGLHRVRYTVHGQPLVSIIVLTSGEHSPHLQSTLAALDRTTAYRNFELVIASRDGGVPVAVQPVLGRVRHRVLEARPSLDAGISTRVNAGAAAANGQHVLLLHEDVRPLEGSWLEAMLELSEQPGVGAVGAKLLDSNGNLQHVGLVLGLNGLIGYPLQRHHADTAGYFSSANCIRNYSAVSGACLMTRRDVFDRVGGFDERMPTLADVDYCLRVGAAGLRVVFTPYARLVHNEAGELDRASAPPEEMAHLRARWGSVLQQDPYYNPNLTREGLDYRVDVRSSSSA